MSHFWQGEGREASCSALPEGTILPQDPLETALLPLPGPEKLLEEKEARGLPWVTLDGQVLNGSRVYYMQSERVKQDSLNSS